MVRKKLRFLLLFMFFPLFGCASPYLLTKQQLKLELLPNEGVALFSCNFANKDKPTQKEVFWVTNVILQEVNQYKPHNEKKIFTIPSPKASFIKKDDLFLFPLKLPRGTYKFSYLNGIFRSLFGVEYSASADKLFDVSPGKINYSGRLRINFFIYKNQQTHGVEIEDKFGEDNERFKHDYPALQNKTIEKDLAY